MEDEKVKLTTREEQVAELIAWGASYKEVPDLLTEKYGGKEISFNTVVKHIQNIFAKLKISKVNELSAWWFQTHEGVDSSHSPFTPRVRERLFSFILLLAITPSIYDMDQAIRPGRLRTSVRVERFQRSRSRRSDDYTYEDGDII